MMNNTIIEQLTYRIVNEVLHEQFLLERDEVDLPPTHPSGGSWWLNPNQGGRPYWEWVEGDPPVRVPRPPDAPEPPYTNPRHPVGRPKYKRGKTHPAGVRPGSKPPTPAAPWTPTGLGAQPGRRNINRPGEGPRNKRDLWGMLIAGGLLGAYGGFGGSRGDQPPDGVHGPTRYPIDFNRPPLWGEDSGNGG